MYAVPFVVVPPPHCTHICWLYRFAILYSQQTSHTRERSAKSLPVIRRGTRFARSRRFPAGNSSFAEWAAVPSSSRSVAPQSFDGAGATLRDIAELSDRRHGGRTTASPSRHDRLSAAHYMKFSNSYAQKRFLPNIT